MELGATPNRATFRPGQRDSIVVGDELRGLGRDTTVCVITVANSSLGGELDDALSGTTTTDLKIRIRKLEQELEELKGSKGKEEESKILVLESLLEDAKRLKSRYEAEYLKEHKEKLNLVAELEEIRAGKGDSGEVSVALRQRLNECVEELEALKKEKAEIEVKCERMDKELTVAKSDRTSRLAWGLVADKFSYSESCQQRSSGDPSLLARDPQSRQRGPRNRNHLPSFSVVGAFR